MPAQRPANAGVPLRWQGTPDGRSLGKPIQVVRDYLAGRPEGSTREELERVVRAHQGGRAPTSPRSFYRILHDLKRGDEIVETAGRIVPRRLTRTRGARNA